MLCSYGLWVVGLSTNHPQPLELVIQSKIFRTILIFSIEAIVKNLLLFTIVILNATKSIASNATSDQCHMFKHFTRHYNNNYTRLIHASRNEVIIPELQYSPIKKDLQNSFIAKHFTSKTGSSFSSFYHKATKTNKQVGTQSVLWSSSTMQGFMLKLIWDLDCLIS